MLPMQEDYYTNLNELLTAPKIESFELELRIGSFHSPLVVQRVLMERPRHITDHRHHHLQSASSTTGLDCHQCGKKVVNASALGFQCVQCSATPTLQMLSLPLWLATETRHIPKIDSLQETNTLLPQSYEMRK